MALDFETREKFDEIDFFELQKTVDAIRESQLASVNAALANLRRVGENS